MSSYIAKKTNEMMSGLICKCGHDYVCHAPMGGGCVSCDCQQTRVGIVDDFIPIFYEFIGLASAVKAMISVSNYSRASEFINELIAVEQKMHPTLEESVVSDSESGRAPKRVI